MIEVRSHYDMSAFPAMDDVAIAAAGRMTDFSGAGCCGIRDLGWICRSEIEAERIARALRKIGLPATVMTSPSHTDPIASQGTGETG